MNEIIPILSAWISGMALGIAVGILILTRK
jgi:hypothetical protein